MFFRGSGGRSICICCDTTQNSRHAQVRVRGHRMSGSLHDYSLSVSTKPCVFLPVYSKHGCRNCGLRFSEQRKMCSGDTASALASKYGFLSLLPCAPALGCSSIRAGNSAGCSALNGSSCYKIHNASRHDVPVLLSLKCRSSTVYCKITVYRLWARNCFHMTYKVATASILAHTLTITAHLAPKYPERWCRRFVVVATRTEPQLWNRFFRYYYLPVQALDERRTNLSV